jgi:hypothetical protein
MQIFLKYEQVSNKSARLVADLLEVLAELGDAVEGVGCLDLGVVVCDQERLGCLVGYDALLALYHRKLAAALDLMHSVRGAWRLGGCVYCVDGCAPSLP